MGMNNVNIMMRDLKKNHPELFVCSRYIKMDIEYGMNENYSLEKFIG